MRKILFFLFFASRMVFAQETSDPIGHVITAKGNIVALDSNQNERALEKKSPVFESDTIRVASSSLAGIKMIDGSLITLVENTEYHIESFAYNTSSDKDNFISELIEGGLRLISGKIGKRNPEEYKIKTPNATMGLRGTLVECLLKGSTLYVHVDQGQATLTNDAGTVIIGTGTVQYAVVSRFDAMPQTLLSKPGQMMP